MKKHIVLFVLLSTSGISYGRSGHEVMDKSIETIEVIGSKPSSSSNTDTTPFFSEGVSRPSSGAGGSSEDRHGDDLFKTQPVDDPSAIASAGDLPRAKRDRVEDRRRSSRRRSLFPFFPGNGHENGHGDTELVTERSSRRHSLFLPRRKIVTETISFPFFSWKWS